MAPNRGADTGFCYGPHALLIVLAAVAVWWWRGRNPPLHYVTARVTQGDIQRAVNMTGTLNPVVTAQVEFFVFGNIKSWSCDYNTLVKAGQICAPIDPATVSTRTRHFIATDANIPRQSLHAAIRSSRKT
jgi:multidrug efflux pump subunit AcrA (membrane-fusion protein)